MWSLTRLSSRDRRALRLGAATTLTLVMVFRLVPAYFTRLATLAEREAALRGQVDRLQSMSASRDTALVRSLESLRDSLAVGLSFTAPAVGAASELASLASSVASDAGVRLDALVPESDSSDSGRFTLIRVRCEGWSDIGGLVSMLDLLESSDALVRVTELSVMASNPDATSDEDERLRLRFVLESLVREKRT